MEKRKQIPFVLVFFALLFWVYLKPEKELPETPAFQPSYIGYDVHNDHFDEFGRMSYKVFADKATNYAEQDKTDFEKPRILMFNLDEKTQKISTWQITSNEGVLFGSEKLIFKGNVIIDNLTKDQLVQTMKTEELTAMLAKNEVMTDLPVQWTGPQMKQSGIGMWASFDTEELIVKEKINAVYFNEKK